MNEMLVLVIFLAVLGSVLVISLPLIRNYIDSTAEPVSVDYNTTRHIDKIG